MEHEDSLPQSQVPATCPKVSVQVQGLLFDCFATQYIFMVRSC